MYKFNFADLFAGIGGFHIAMSRIGGKCAMISEINKHAIETYKANFNIEEDQIYGDISKIDWDNAPDFDVLCAGFPCQPFSSMGNRKGFNDINGEHFFEIIKAINIKKPKVVFLENVLGLLNHNNGKTIKTMITKIKQQGYKNVQVFRVNAYDFNLPQNRKRIFIIANNLNKKITEPEKQKLEVTMSDILNGPCEKTIGYTIRVGGVGSKIGNKNWEHYIVNGEVVRIDIPHMLRMQGFPQEFNFPVSKAQARKQLGNTVPVNAVLAYGKCILDQLLN